MFKTHQGVGLSQVHVKVDKLKAKDRPVLVLGLMLIGVRIRVKGHLAMKCSIRVQEMSRKCRC